MPGEEASVLSKVDPPGGPNPEFNVPVPIDGEGEDEQEDTIYVPLDADIKVFQSTYDLETRLGDRHFEKKDQTDYVTLNDVEGEMDELKTDKDVDEGILQEIRKKFEELTKNTVTKNTDKEKRNNLTAHRICEIEKRLEKDPSLQLDAEEKAKYPLDIPDDPANHVKRQLIKNYGKIKKSSYDLSQVTMHNLEDRMQILSGKRR